MATSKHFSLAKLSAICRGDEVAIPAAIRGDQKGWISTSLLTILAGCGLYGIAVGLWRAPEQALFLSIKFPLLIFSVVLFNGFLNGMLAQLLGTGLSFRQTLTAILMSFATFGAVLGGLFPVAFFMAIGGPEFTPDNHEAYGRFVLIHTAIIAYAGLVSNVQMLGTLMQVSGKSAAIRTFFAWTAGNLFVGAQLAWNLRPFFGNPDREIQFLREKAFEGNFYEAIVRLSKFQLSKPDGGGVLFAAVALAVIAFAFIAIHRAVTRLNKLQTKNAN